MTNINKSKFCLFYVYEDMFGTWCVKQIIGGLYNKNYVTEFLKPCGSLCDAYSELDGYELAYRVKGYKYADMGGIDNFSLTPQTVIEYE